MLFLFVFSGQPVFSRDAVDDDSSSSKGLEET
jgi:hypothetical protein